MWESVRIESDMNSEDLNNESDGSGQSKPQSESKSRAALRQAKDDLANYAREQDIDLSVTKLTREQLHDRKLARLEMAVANLEGELREER